MAFIAAIVSPEFTEPPPPDELQEHAARLEKGFKEDASLLRRVSVLAAPWPEEGRPVTARYVRPSATDPFHTLEYQCVTCDEFRRVVRYAGTTPQGAAKDVSRVRREAVEHARTHAGRG
ncbi:hypothetical protein [Sorangium cellulosum]|uniref:hypothetical protein n=1 Tax=Sorangium cellulosum TaxID=56 RepID=UPI0013319FD1|nr:hypothetical protein [Sorangium cellulosum]